MQSLPKWFGCLENRFAAPSANRFGPGKSTTAQHVLDELDERIPLIIDAGPTDHGVESTIVSLRANNIVILRVGNARLLISANSVIARQ